MKRNITVLDFPSIVAAKIISDANQGLRFKQSKKVPIATYIQNKESHLVTLTETDHGNLTFICPNCKRQNILEKQEIVVAMCKFCQPAQSPD